MDENDQPYFGPLCVSCTRAARTMPGKECILCGSIAPIPGGWAAWDAAMRDSNNESRAEFLKQRGLGELIVLARLLEGGGGEFGRYTLGEVRREIASRQPRETGAA